MMNSMRMVEFPVVEAPAHPAAAPHLESHEVPYLLRVEAVVRRRAFAEVGERRAHLGRIEKAGPAHARRRQAFVEKRCQVPAQPVAERNRESLLGALDQLARPVPIEHLAQQVLGAERSAAKTQRQAQRALCEAVVEERLAALEARRPRRAIEL